MQTVVDSLLTHYQKTGSGKQCVLLLHGWGDSHVTFKDLTRSLSKTYTVVSLDLPGFGQSQIPNEVWSLDNYAHFVKNFCKKIGADDLYGVVAHSNGGAVTIRAITLGALKPQKLVLLASSGIRDRQKLRRVILKVIAKVGKVVTFWLPSRHKKKLQKKLYGAAGSDLLVVPQLQETFKKTVRQDVQEDAKHVTTPTLLIYGSNDTATPPGYGRIYANLMQNATLEVIEGAGHFVHHDQSASVNVLVSEFLS